MNQSSVFTKLSGLRRRGVFSCPRFALGAFWPLAIAVITPPTLGDQVILNALKDNTLYESASGSLSNGAGEHFFAGRTNQSAGSIRRAVIAFDVAGTIPAGSTITGVTLTLYLSRGGANGTQSVSLHRALANWGEGTSVAGGNEGEGAPATIGDATWLHTFYNTMFWAGPGGDFSGTSSATTSVGGNGYYNWTSATMIADVQAWLNSPATNFGWLVRGNESTGQTAKRFDSHQVSQANRRPKLTIDFTLPATIGACCFTDGSCLVLSATNCGNQGGTYQGNGTTCTPNPCPQPTGACCFPDESCLELTQVNCGNQGGTYQGDFTTCTPNPCIAPTGACCLTDGSCIELSQATCMTQGGAYEGDGTTCTPNPCPQPTGACCFSGAVCMELASVACATQGGDYQGDFTTCTPNPCPLNLEPFVDPLPIPGVAQPVTGSPGEVADYEISIRQVQQQLHRDLAPTTVWGYNGLFPGPTIEARTDMPITVKWINDLRDSGGALRTNHYLDVDLCPLGAEDVAKVVPHLHGGHVPAASDGYPEATFLPGSDETYFYPNNQPATTLWYHDHAHGVTRLNIIMGLAAYYIIRDDVEDALNLPSGEYEIGLAIQDRSFNLDGTWSYPSAWQDHFFGDVILVNGKVWPYLNVKRGKYRFRILEGSTSRTYTLSLSNGATFHQIGTDGGLLPAPVPLTELTIAPGERADVVIDFEPYAVGTEIILTNSAPAPFPGNPGEGVIPNVMKFIVTAGSGSIAPLPVTLRPVEPLLEADAAQDRELVLRKNNNEPCAGSEWLINDLHWHDVTEFPVLGTTEIWRFVNRSGVMHPMHMHLVLFQTLDRQQFEVIDDQIVPIGQPVPPAPNEAGWKDTVRVGPSEIVRVIARFDDYTGLYPYHCHILEHEEHQMMRQFNAICTRGDVNQDSWVDGTDIVMFVDTLISGGTAGTAEYCATDMDGDQILETDQDVSAFVNCLLTGTCP